MSRLSRQLVDADEGFAMMFTILLTVVIVSTSIAICGLLIHQVNPTLFSRKSVRTVDAASAGLQAAVGQLRSATTAGAGDLTKLPCSDPADAGGVSLRVGKPARTVSVAGDEITGTVSNDGSRSDTATYRTEISYYSLDPTPHETDATTTWWSNNDIGCKAGIVASVPTYAFIQSFGSGNGLPGVSSATTGNRTQHAIYQFLATNGNTAGGRLPEYIAGTAGGSAGTMCMDAGTDTPVAGAVLTMQPCLALGAPRQTWQYRNDLSIFYGGNTTLNLCVQNVSGSEKLQTCTTPAPPDPTSGNVSTYPFISSTQQNQEWAFNDNGHLSAPLSPFIGTTGGNVAEGSETGSQCLFPGTQDPNTPAVAGSAVTIGVCDSSTTGATAWNPDPQTGAGKSGGSVSGLPASPTNQYVNYAEFGRCLDVTGQDVGADHLIDYPCKQAPNSCLLTWNQVWSYTPVSGVYGTMSVNYASGRKACDTALSTKYCLTAPAPSVSNLITLSPCAPTPGANQLWDPTGLVSGNYPNSYLLISMLSGLCMAADPSLQQTYGSSSIVATLCDGSDVPSAPDAAPNPLLLKWNAPALVPVPGLRNLQEDTGPGSH